MILLTSWLCLSLYVLRLFGLALAFDIPHTRQYFYVGPGYITGGGGHVRNEQMYVEVLTPVGPTKPYPLVLISGLGQTGTNWLNKPDGNAGWSSYFLARGYILYIVDQPSRGRSPWLPTSVQNVISLVALTAEIIEQRFTAPELYNSYFQAGLHTQWPGGPGKGVMGEPAFDAYFQSVVPSVISNVLQQTAMQTACVALLDRIGKKVILLGHSQGGTIPFLMADLRPKLVHSVVVLEPAGPPFVEPALNGGVPARAWGMSDIPLAYSPPVTDPNVDIVKEAIISNTTGIDNCTLQADSPAPRKLINLAKIPVVVVTAGASWHVGYN